MIQYFWNSQNYICKQDLVISNFIIQMLYLGALENVHKVSHIILTDIKTIVKCKQSCSSVKSNAKPDSLTLPHGKTSKKLKINDSLAFYAFSQKLQRKKGNTSRSL